MNKCLAYALNAYVDVVHLEQAAVVTLINKSQNDIEKNIHAYKSTKWLVNTHAGTNKRLARESTTNMYSYTSKQKKKKTHKIGSAFVRQMIE